MNVKNTAMNNRIKFGIIGKDISYSFSKKYFTEKFVKLGLDNYKYLNFDIPEIDEFPFIMYQKKEDFKGLNVTIPYKESVMKYLDLIDPDALKIGAVNTIKFSDENELIGYNTDVYGFEHSLTPLLKLHHTKALILGTGGASKAVSFVLNKLNIEFKFVSRKVQNDSFLYSVLQKEHILEHTLIINCTPLGTSPKFNEAPNIPYKFLTEKHLLYDLIYNPEETKFLNEGKKRGTIIKNGSQMLHLQAEKSWEIWNS